jgi:hypothetical protein
MKLLLHKKVLISSFFVLLLISVGIFYGKNIVEAFKSETPKEKVMNLSDVKGLLIYSKWESYISAYEGEEIKIQIPVYDFDNLLSKANLKIENFSIGEVKDYNLTLHNRFTDFKQYNLEFTFIPQKTGMHSFNDLTVRIETDRKVYKKKIGHWVFDVTKDTGQKNIFDIVGGSAFSPRSDKEDVYEYRSTLVNKTKQPLKLKQIQISNDEIQIKNSAVNSMLLPGKEETIFTEVDIKKQGMGVYLKPKLTYTLNNEVFVFPLSQTIYASEVPFDELAKLLKEEKMLK